MSDYAGWLNSGATGAEALGKPWGKLFTPGIAMAFNSTAYQVTQRGSGANMSVDIAVGAALIDLTDYGIPVWSSATINKTVTAPDPTNPRNDIVVIYVNLAAYGANNNQGATQFIIVSGVAAGTPSDPTDASIQAAVGVGNPWKKLARITLPSGVPSVINAYITDLRSPVAFAGNLWGGASNSVGHTVPNVADDTVVLANASQTVSGKTLGAGNTILSAALSLSKTTDANGWTIYDYGSFKKYIKVFISFATQAAVSGNTTSGALAEISGTALPVGISNMSQLKSLTYSIGTTENSPCFIVGMEAGSGIYNATQTVMPTFYARNITSSSVNLQNLTLTVELTT